MKPLVVALTGTDHHPFARMVDWVDTAAARRPDVRFVVQHGVTRAPRIAEGRDYLSHDDLRQLLQLATVVVCHGGPGTIMDAREAGHVPLCVPRDPEFGEHVDGHQQRFAVFVGNAGIVRAVGSSRHFQATLDGALAAAMAGTLAGAPAESAPATNELRDTARARMATELDGLLAVRPTRLGRLRRLP